MSRKREREQSLRRYSQQRRAQLSKEGEERRRFLKLLGLGLLATAGAGVAATLGLLNPGEDDSDSPTARLATIAVDEGATDEVYTKLDEALGQLYDKLVKHDKIVGNEKALLLRPLQLFRINRNNPNRNRNIMERAAIATEESGGKGPFEFRNSEVEYFSIDVKRNSAKAPDAFNQSAAAYSFPERTFLVDPNFDPNNKLHWLIAYHELVHVSQDTGFRRQLDSGDPQALQNAEFFYGTGGGTRPRVLGLAEQQAFIAELTVMDILTGGNLRADAISYSPETSTALLDSYMVKLNARPQERQTVDMLLQFADRMYTSNTNMSNIDNGFATYLNGKYRDGGFDVYEYGLGGIIQPIP